MLTTLSFQKSLIVAQFQGNYLKVAPYSFFISRKHGTKAQASNVRAQLKENVSVLIFDFYDVSMSTESETDSKIEKFPGFHLVNLF